jgi:hypothetical protein
MSENMESLAGVTGASMAEDVPIAEPQHPMPKAAPGLIDTPDLALTVDDGLEGDTTPKLSLQQYVFRAEPRSQCSTLPRTMAGVIIASRCSDDYRKKIKRLSVRRCHIAARRPQEVYALPILKPPRRPRATWSSPRRVGRG